MLLMTSRKGEKRILFDLFRMNFKAHVFRMFPCEIIPLFIAALQALVHAKARRHEVVVVGIIGFAVGGSYSKISNN